MLTDAPQCGGQRARSATEAADAPGTTALGPIGWVLRRVQVRCSKGLNAVEVRGTREVSPAGQETPTERCTTHDSVHDSLARQRTTHWARLGTTVTVAALKLAECGCDGGQDRW